MKDTATATGMSTIRTRTKSDSVRACARAGLNPINRMKALKNIALSYLRQEYDLHRYSACANMNDAYSVLTNLYGQDLFNEA